jgi:hypothetical protein
MERLEMKQAKNPNMSHLQTNWNDKTRVVPYIINNFVKINLSLA